MVSFTQILTFIGLIFFVSSVQAKQKRNLILLQLLANLFYGIAYFLLDIKIAFFMNMISVIKCVLLYFSKEKPSKIYLYILNLLILALGIYGYTGPLSLIPIITTLLYTISTWQDDMKMIRYLFILAAMLWIYYNYQSNVYIAIIGNIFEITSGIISIIRYRNIKAK